MNIQVPMKISLFLFVVFISPLTYSLKVGFYKQTCPNAEVIVRQVVRQRFAVDKSVAPALLRMHFHDCFVRGCDASILIDSTSNNQAEKDANPNLTIREFTLIDQIKFKLEATCPGVVSCADIITLATRDVVSLTGGPKYKIPTGRRDGLISTKSDVNIPGPTITVTQAQQLFTSHGLTLNDMVILLGAHTIGVAHCNFFRARISNFQATGAPDPTMDKDLIKKLKGICGSSGNPTAFLDQNTSFVFDNQYYNMIRNNKGVMQIDQELGLDPLSLKLVQYLGENNVMFRRRFAKAMIKMGNIQVLEGNKGEIRKNCSAFNKKVSVKNGSGRLPMSPMLCQHIYS